MEENFSPKDSLQLIQSMISKTKTDIRCNRFYFLLWGWFAFLAILAQFVLKVVLHNRYHYLVWSLTIPAVIITIIHSSRRNKNRSSRTYIGDSMSFLWTGIGISFFVMSFIISSAKEGWFFSYPFFILLYGLGTFVSGRILQFTPLVMGGIFNWILACVSVYFSFDYQMLFAATAIFTSYIIPGHLLGVTKNR